MPSIFLVGPMGSGKSTVGRALARRTGLRFIDSDRELEARCGVDIPTIFEYEGEGGFRDREARLIDELTTHDGIVLATGGGAVLRPENRACLALRGYVVLLSVDIGEQLRRVGRDPNRPLLNTSDPEARLRSLMSERAPIYRDVAHLEVHTDARRMHHVVNRIEQHLLGRGLLGAPRPAEAARTPASTCKP